MKIGNNLRLLRIKYNYTQAEVAELSELNEKFYGRLERDESVPTLATLEKLCIPFDITPEILINILKSGFFEEDRKTVVVKNDERYCNCCGTVFVSSLDIAHCPICDCTDDSGFID